MKTNKVKVTFYCIGIKGRDRKEKRHSYKFCYLNHAKNEDVTEEEITQSRARALAWILEFKNPRNLEIYLTPVELDDGVNADGSIGMQSESYIMFSDKVIKIEI